MALIMACSVAAAPRPPAVFDQRPAWLEQCGGNAAACPRFAEDFARYSRSHSAMTHGRTLTIDDSWPGEGMGFMVPAAADWLLVAMATGRALRFNVSRAVGLHWTDFFSGMGGGGVGGHDDWPSVEWAPPAAGDGGAATVTTNLPGSGMNEHSQAKWEPLIDGDTAHVRLVGGMVKVIPDMAARREWRRRGAAPLVDALRNGTAAWTACTPCAMAAVLQPKWDRAPWTGAHALLPEQPIQHCLKIRTGFAENATHDAAPAGEAARAPDVDAAYAVDDARCGQSKLKLETPGTATPRVFPISAAFTCAAKAVGAASAPRAVVASDARALVPPLQLEGGGEVGGEVVAAATAGAKALLLTDAPGLQAYLRHTGRPWMHATNGTGVDPTNTIKSQNNTASNVAKVVVDYFLQGFCGCSLTLMGSEFYHSAETFTTFAPSLGAACAVSDSCPWESAHGRRLSGGPPPSRR